MDDARRQRQQRTEREVAGSARGHIPQQPAASEFLARGAAPPGLGPFTAAAVASGQRLLGNRAISRMLEPGGRLQRMTVPLPKGIELTGGAGVSVLKKLKGKHISVTHKQVQQTKAGKMIPLTGFHYTNESTQAHWYWNNEVSKTKFNMGIGGNPGAPARQGGGVYKETAKQANRFGIELEDPTPAKEEEEAETPAAAAPEEVVDSSESEAEEETPASPPAPEKVKDSWDDED